MISRNPTQLLCIGTDTVSYCYKQLSSRQKLNDKKNSCQSKNTRMQSDEIQIPLKFKQNS